jgi:hypothetical protein
VEVQPVAQIPLVLLVLVVMMGLLIISDLFTAPIMTLLRRRFPNLPAESEGFLVWGTLIMVAFVFGLLVMYLLLHP